MKNSAFFYRLFIVFCFLSLSSTQLVRSQSFTRAFTELGYAAVEQTEAVQIFRKEGNYLVGFNLLKIDLTSYQVLDSTKKAPNGTFLDTLSSPFFKRIAYQDVIDDYNDSYLINASFFESYDASTQLSYPIYYKNNWLTSGSSIYGPVKNPKNEYYATISLLALQIGSGSAKIQPFSATKPPQDLLIVSQNYKDHPALVLANNRVTRFLLVTTFDDNQDDNDEWLVLSIGFGTITDRASELEKIIEPGHPIMTLDGGSSVLFSHPTLGILHKPARYNPVTFQETIIDLPHYLIMTPKK